VWAAIRSIVLLHIQAIFQDLAGFNRSDMCGKGHSSSRVAASLQDSDLTTGSDLVGQSYGCHRRTRFMTDQCTELRLL